jgi:hypothetical protein
VVGDPHRAQLDVTLLQVAAAGIVGVVVVVLVVVVVVEAVMLIDILVYICTLKT